jgi:hypothetical protein
LKEITQTIYWIIKDDTVMNQIFQVELNIKNFLDKLIYL